jgi:hypothetical protein
MNDRITEIERDIKDLKQKTALSILRIGDRLAEAKQLLNRGEWEPWLLNNISMSTRTARAIMKASRAFPESERRALASIDITKIYYLSELDEEDRRELIEGDDLKEYSTRELKQIIKETRLKRYTIFKSGELEAIRQKVGALNDLQLVKGYHDYLLEMAQDIAEMVLDLEIIQATASN